MVVTSQQPSSASVPGSNMAVAQRRRTAVLVNLAMVVEQANEQVLPAVYLFVGRSLNATPAQLGTLTLCRALVQTLASPLSGILGDRYDRVLVLSCGAFIWGLMTAAMACTATLHQAMAFAGINGMGLALLVPCCQSLIADLFPSEARGRAFGVMALTGALGGMTGGVFATNMGGRVMYGLEGWRFAFHCVAVVSILTGLAAYTWAVDPRRLPNRTLHATDVTSLVTHPAAGGAGGGSSSSHTTAAPAGVAGDEEASGVSSALLYHQHSVHIHSKGPGSIGSSVSPTPGSDVGSGAEEGPEEGDCSGKARAGRPRHRGVLADIAWMMRIRTFQAIVLQGIVGCFPWQATVFFTLWLQLQGFKDSTSSLLVATFGMGIAAGSLVGGTVGDRLARWSPNHGRILTAQISVASGIPLTLLLLKGVPAVPQLAGVSQAYALVLFCLGLTCSWAGAGCNSPIFAEIVPDELRSTIYAFDRSFEGSIAACAAPVVGLLAERVFGFQGTLTEEALSNAELRRANASALSSSLATCMVIPWVLCLLAYSLLHLCYAQDKARARLWGGHSSGSPGRDASAGRARRQKAGSTVSWQYKRAGYAGLPSSDVQQDLGAEQDAEGVRHIPDDWEAQQLSDPAAAIGATAAGASGHSVPSSGWPPGSSLGSSHHHQQQQTGFSAAAGAGSASYRQARLEEFYDQPQQQQQQGGYTPGGGAPQRTVGTRSAWMR